MLTAPLEWPIGWTKGRVHLHSKFGGRRGVTLERARSELETELGRMRATEIVISTNVPIVSAERWNLRALEPGDHGAAVYFTVAGAQRALACDKWMRVADNLHALALHVEAIRGQLRWGVGSVDQAFGGYKALPAMGARRLWYEVLAVPHTATKDEIDRKRLELLGTIHPDRPGGDAELAAEINAAYREALDILKAEARP